MDITTHSISDKENHSPVAEKHVTFPEWIATSPTKKQGIEHSRFSKHDNNEPVQPGVLKGQTTMDKRGAWPKVASLACSPPRPSYSEKVKGIFANPASNAPAYWNSNAAAESCLGGPQFRGSNRQLGKSYTSNSSTSTLTSESELERQLHIIGNRVVRSPLSSGDPIEDLERAAITSSPAVSRAQSEYSTYKMQDRGQAREGSSSDEWTGDDVFLPAQVRRQNREKQIRERQNQARQMREKQYLERYKDLPNTGAGTLPSPEKLRRVAIQASIRSGPLRSPRASRFRNAATHMPLPYPLRELYPEGVPIKKEEPAHDQVPSQTGRSMQVSDTDDEADSDSDA